MGRFLAIVAVLGGLGVYFVIETQGVDRAFGGVFARFTRGTPGASASAAEPERRRGADWWEQGEGTRPAGIGQGVRERVNRAMDTGARRHGGGG